MNINIGFCEIGLVTSLFFYQQSWWMGVILFTGCILAKLIAYALDWSDKQEKAKVLKDANDNLAKSLAGILDVTKKDKQVQEKATIFTASNAESNNILDFINKNYTGSKKK